MNSLKPDVVFLQVVLWSELKLRNDCGDYFFILSCENNLISKYYNAILLRTSTTTFLQQHVIPFNTSQMGRKLLIVKVCIL